MRRLLARLFAFGARGLVALCLVGLMAAGIGLLHRRADAVAGAAAEVLLPVETVAVAAATGYTAMDRFVGRLEPARTTRLASERGGLVVEVAADEGATVDAGAVVARLDTAVLEAERDRLLADRARTVADLELARLTLERQQALYADGHIPAQRLDESRLAVDALQAALEAADAAIAAVDIQLCKSVLRAPFAGRIGARLIDDGAVVAAGTPVLDILEAGRPQARIGVSPEAVRHLVPGQRYRLWTDDGEAYQARLQAVQPDLAT